MSPGSVSRVLAVALAVSLAATAARAAGPSLPTPLERTLPNGLRVIVFPRPGLPIVQIQLQAAAGLRAEPPGQEGVAYLTAQMLRQGSTSRSAEDIATELDTLGATLAVNVTRDAANLAAGSRVAELESLLELVSDAAVNPLFTDESFQSARRQIAAELGAQAQNPAALADERANALAFGAHPYAHAARGNLPSLLTTTLDQVREFHRDRWRPDRAVLAVAGDVDPERVFASANEWFGRWAGRNAAEPRPSGPSARRGVFVSDLRGSTIAEIRALLPAPGRGDAGYPGWVVLREALVAALPPGTHAALTPGRDASLLLVSARALPESAAVVAGRMRSALSLLASAPLAPDRLAAARKRAAQGWGLSLETLGQLLSSWLAGDAAGLPPGHLAAAPDAFHAAELPSLAALDAGHATLLVQGPAARMSGLASLGPVDTLGAEAQAPQARPAPATPGQQRRGKQLVAQAVAAHGGTAKLKAIRQSELEGELHMDVGGRSLSGQSRLFRQDPARLVFTTRFMEFERRQVLDGTRGWALSMVGDTASLFPADSLSLLGLHAIFESDLVHLLRAASDPAADPVATGRADVDGKPCERVEFVAKAGGRTRLSLDAVTHRVVAVESSPTPQGAWRDRRRWSDFDQVEGVWWPRSEARELDGEPLSTTTLRRIIVNGDVDTTLFRRPIVRRGHLIGLE